jgi:hypothetical protein
MKNLISFVQLPKALLIPNTKKFPKKRKYNPPVIMRLDSITNEIKKDITASAIFLNLGATMPTPN